MSEPAYELGPEPELDTGHELDAEDALRGVVNQLTINGHRMSVIIPGSVIEIMPMLAELLRKGQAAGYLPALLSVAMPWASVLPEPDRERFASDLADAAAAGTYAPERLAGC